MENKTFIRWLWESLELSQTLQFSSSGKDYILFLLELKQSQVTCFGQWKMSWSGICHFQKGALKNQWMRTTFFFSFITICKDRDETATTIWVLESKWHQVELPLTCDGQTCCVYPSNSLIVSFCSPTDFFFFLEKNGFWGEKTWSREIWNRR